MKKGASMAYQDSASVIVLAKYNGTAAGTDVVEISNAEAIEVSKTPGGGKYKRATGRKGAQQAWVNTDNTQGSVSLETYLRGNDDAATALDTPPGWSDVLQICCLDETIDTGTPGQETVIYTPTQDDPAASEVVVYRDGEKDTISKALGVLTISGTAGEPIMLKADIAGYSNGAPVVDANPAFVADDNALIVLKSTDNITINDVSRAVTSFEFGSGTANTATYAVSDKIHSNDDHEPYIDLTYIADTTNTNDIWTLLTAETEHEVVITAGASSGKKVEIKGFKAQVDPTQPPTKGVVDGKLAYTARVFLKDDSTNESYHIKYGYFA
jgi:hypothetical protein